MATWKPAFLIHGDDHGRIAERRARLRTMAEAESGTGGVEVLEGEAAAPEMVAAALSAMTFAVGRRFVIVEGVERWKEADAKEVAGALATADPETLTAAFFAREDGRLKAPKVLHDAVKKVGGAIACESAVKPKELPRWVAEQARALGLQIDGTAARALVARVGDRQQRLLRELEKLALELGPGATVTPEHVEAAAASAERRVWALADSVVAGDAAAATRLLLELRAQGDRVAGLQYNIVKRLREAHEVATALAAGQTPSDIRPRLRMPPYIADRFIADVRKRDVATYRRGLELMADLEARTRGGGGAVVNEDTAALRAVLEIAGAGGR